MTEIPQPKADQPPAENHKPVWRSPGLRMDPAKYQRICDGFEDKSFRAGDLFGIYLIFGA